ncbi:MAG: hypothetical protein H6825_11450 [Planctomycetes bacterium]|nr:hypothetical protein [Planctomycetota bacterium]
MPVRSLTPTFLVLACVTALAPASAAGDTPEMSPGARALVEQALPGIEASQVPASGRALFELVLGSDLFVSGQVGPFDVHVLAADGLRRERDATKVLDQVLKTLEPAAELVARLWPEGGEGLVSQARLPLLIADSGDGEPGFLELLSLLDHCEQLGYSGWLPTNVVDTPENRGAEVVRTWEVQLFNLAHATIAERRKAWLAHGVGYYSLAFVANRALRRGAWGMVPPWLANGLIDELDIAAYERAWVGQESWTCQTPGWFRPGWSGFVPKGHNPPPPVVGPPADLATTVKNSGDPWLGFDDSETRHWSALQVDRKTEAPFSFVDSAEAESFLPRDRAAARCLMHLLLSAGDREAPLLTTLLDREVATPPDGMPDSDALPVIFARALGGVPEVERLDALDTRSLLVELERPDLIALLERQGAQDALLLSDHREQSRWLYGRSRYDSATRLELFNAFLEIEFEQQMAMWKAIAPHLDAGLASALERSKRYPSKERDIVPVRESFWESVATGPSADEVGRSSSSRGRSRR